MTSSDQPDDEPDADVDRATVDAALRRLAAALRDTEEQLADLAQTLQRPSRRGCSRER